MTYRRGVRMPIKIKTAKPILYICPYCKAGRFTEDDGFAGAERHVKTHVRGGGTRRRKKVSTFNDMFLDDASVGYNDPESVMAG